MLFKSVVLNLWVKTPVCGEESNDSFTGLTQDQFITAKKISYEVVLGIILWLGVQV